MTPLEAHRGERPVELDVCEDERSLIITADGAPLVRVEAGVALTLADRLIMRAERRRAA